MGGDRLDARRIIGVFSTTAYAVERRTPEIGVRMALGADASSVVRTIVRDAGGPLVIGLGAGTLARRAARIDPVAALRAE